MPEPDPILSYYGIFEYCIWLVLSRRQSVTAYYESAAAAAAAVALLWVNINAENANMPLTRSFTGINCIERD